MPFAAFTLLALAAFNVGVPWLDRLGTAALGFACLSLTFLRLRPASKPNVLQEAMATLNAAYPEHDDDTAGVVPRIAEYGRPAARHPH